ncbi:MAG: hypothetical protein WC783_05410 [Candidatus Paceibacterota bacterium]|jgi:hypothetical protein
MDEETKKLLEETFALAKENNSMLHSLRRSMRMARFMSLLYWVFIIGSALGAYYFLQPYIDQLKSIYSSTSNFFN